MLRQPTLAILSVATLALTGCGDETTDGTDRPLDELRCGSGTREVDGTCIATDVSGEGLQCGIGTLRAGNFCEVEFDRVCGEHTEISGDQCLGFPSGGATCGEGTRLIGDECVPAFAELCGPGTRVDGGRCVGENVSTPTSIEDWLDDPSIHHIAGGQRWHNGDYLIPFALADQGLGLTQSQNWSADPDYDFIGEGAALLVMASHLDYLESHEAESFEILELDCGQFDIGDMDLMWEGYAAAVFTRWQGGRIIERACAAAGSLRVEALGGGDLQVTMTVEFDDGSTIIDKTVQFEDTL